MSFRRQKKLTKKLIKIYNLEARELEENKTREGKRQFPSESKGP